MKHCARAPHRTWLHLASPSKAGSMETPGLMLLRWQLWEVRRNVGPSPDLTSFEISYLVLNFVQLLEA